MKLIIAAVVLFSLSSAYARCYNTSEIIRNAHEVVSEAKHFDKMIDRIAGYSHLSKDVHALENEANHFHRSVDRGVNCRHIRRDFRDVAKKYRHLSDVLRRAHRVHNNRHVMNDFHDLQYAFQDLRYEVMSSGRGGGEHGDNGRGRGHVGQIR